VQGYRHLREGVECQDAHRSAFEPTTRSYILAVSDGAGSRPRSAEGATLAVGIAVRVFGEGLSRHGAPTSADHWNDWLRTSFSTILSEFLKATASLGASSAEFATTLTAAVLSPPWLGVVSLGDGLVVVEAGSDAEGPLLHVISDSGNAGEYVNETQFLTTARALDHATIRCVCDPGLSAVLLGTDGILPIGVHRDGDAQRPNRTFIAPVLRSFANPRADPTWLTRLLLEQRISRVSGDDKTVLAAVRT
jgi:hypothetical protein